MAARFLVISDLHFQSTGRLQKPRTSVMDAHFRNALTDNQARTFLSDLKKMLEKSGPKDQWPRALLVTGDIVDRGGTDSTNGSNEYDQAVAFLKDIAALLNISNEHVYVVPGNHDVDWTDDLSQAERFKNFLEATKDFKTPTFRGDAASPVLVELPNLSSSLDVEMLLLISPTFSGLADPDNDRLVRLLRSLLGQDTSQILAKIEQSFSAGRKPLDIAAIGSRQRESINRMSSHYENPIRLALMHHHLLPDPFVDATHFESVVDSGKVIDHLLRNKFDLVLTGHKHNRRLVQYKHKEELLDIYSSPSLFEGSEPGFTILTINGPDHTYYASLEYYSTDGCRLIGHDDLVREGRILPELYQLCAMAETSEQREILTPALESVVRTLQWSKGHPAKPLVDNLWADLAKELKRTGTQRLTFRQPYLHQHWSALLHLAESVGVSELRLASDSDLDFWMEAERPGSDARRYEDPVTQFKGKKTRALVLSKDDLQESRPLAEKADRVIAAMRDRGMSVFVVDAEELPDKLEKDFGLIGSLAVSRFVGQGSGSRHLEESFRRNDITEMAESWERLQSFSMWSTSDNQSFADWVSDLRKT